MVKKIAIALLCTVLGTSLYARDDISPSDLFIGLEIDGTKVDSITEVSKNGTYDGKYGETSDSVIEYGIRFGAEKNDWRTTLLYTYYNDDDSGLEETMHKSSLLLDYFIWSSDSDSYSVKPYIGLHVGYMSYDLTGTGAYGSDKTIADDSGLFYGGQVGIAMKVADAIGIDISYKYSLTSLDDLSIDLPDGSDTYHLENSLDNMGSIAFSINYFY